MTSLCLNQWPPGRAQEHTSGRVARFWAAPCGLWGLLMALQLRRGPGQRWMEEAGRRPRSTRSGLGRWMGKKGQQPGTFSGSTSSQVHVQVPRKAPFTNRCGAGGRTAASIRCLPQAREQVGSGRAGPLQNCGGDHVVCRAGQWGVPLQGHIPLRNAQGTSQKRAGVRPRFRLEVGQHHGLSLGNLQACPLCPAPPERAKSY